jgi:hypothetical protein
LGVTRWNDASFVRAIDGCAFKTLSGQNVLDGFLSLVFLGAWRLIFLRLP